MPDAHTGRKIISNLLRSSCLLIVFVSDQHSPRQNAYLVVSFVMRPRNFAAALGVATTLGFVAGRWSAPTGPVRTSAPAAIRAATAYAGTVTKVVDGDTLVVSLSEGLAAEEKIRLLAIDTPERGQRWYAQSRAALVELLHGKEVWLEFEKPGKMKRDKYGRILAFVFVDGVNANIEMVRLGWSAYLSKYGGERFSHELIVAEEAARAARRGIWSLR